MRKILLRLISFSMLAGLTSCFNCSSYYAERIQPMSIVGVVSGKYRDSLNHTIPRVVIHQLTGTSEFTLYDHDISHLWDSLRVGDGLEKEAGTMEFYRIREGKRTLFQVSCDE